MQTILLTVLYFSISLIGGYISYKRCKVGKIPYPTVIASILFVVILFIIGVLGKTQLPEYMKTVFFTSPESTVNIFNFYIIIYITALYIIFTLITEDFLKNLSMFLSFFGKTSKKQ